ncbi:Nucleotide pyrophosphohydrolase [Alteracholeplasma palmae J233]|uniref:Nucleotide pyrophosphohydrolase n=1 Tax=Alteracholeplasma palmae (strain ATCC 49389 / J233) TaxID=1318466 RepID=U4KNW9_ALTPJ|nr:MazG-like family protein [Alteracholeplasma palmae]CCV63905.1 Nucleotide pyrophosphohydrolase [Alteracholeplasma palmae J233]
MVDIKAYQNKIIEFYKKRNWYQLDPFIRINFLTEEVGEVSRAVRTIEIGRDRPDEKVPLNMHENLVEELGDVLDNLLIIADKYQISLEDIMESHLSKLEKRYKE